MSTQGEVGPEGSIDVEVIHKDGSVEPVAVHPFVAFTNWIKGWFQP
jgi:hypothetical protein